MLRRALIVASALLLATSAVACSKSSDSSGSKDAAGVTAASSANGCKESASTPVTALAATTTTVVDPSGSPCDSVNANEFCSSAYLMWVQDVFLCFQLVNRTRKFSGPDALDARFELTIPYALCGPSGPPTPCKERTGYRGFPRWQKLGSVYGRRTLTPNPFADTGYIQFIPDSIWQGVEVRLMVGSQQAPMSLTQGLAQPYFQDGDSGSNGGDCDTQGEFLTCSLDPSSWTRGGKVINPKYTFTTRPTRIRITNSIGSSLVSLKLMSSEPGNGMIMDPVATSGMDLIAKGGIGLTGGYRQVSGSGSKSWTASYCIVDSAGGCTPVAISLAYSMKDGALVNDSTCTVTERTAAKTYICDKPAITGTEEDLIFTVNIKDF